MDALWLSPIYPSPMADFGYDVSDYTAVDPVFGTLADFDALVEAAHERGLARAARHRALPHLDRAPVVPRAPGLVHLGRARPTTGSRRSAGPPGAPLDGRYYLHSFYPEQPDLDWRNPEVVAAMQDVLRFWLDRGVDGYRIDAIDRLLKDAELRDDPPASEAVRPAAERGRGPARAHELAQRAGHGGGARRRSARRRATRLLVGEVYLPSAKWQPYLEHFDAVFAFELLHVPVGGGAAAARRSSAHHEPPGRGLGDVEPRLRPAGHALRRARTRAPRRCCC